MTNINEKTGIAFGIISANCLDSELVQSLMFDYGTNHSEIVCFNEMVSEFLFSELTDEQLDELSDDEVVRQELAESLGFNPDFDFDFMIDEPLITGEYQGVTYQTSWLGGALNFVIFESPVITEKANRGSPCVPNMGVLDDLDGDYQCYSIPDDWRSEY